MKENNEQVLARGSRPISAEESLLLSSRLLKRRSRPYNLSSRGEQIREAVAEYTQLQSENQILDGKLNVEKKKIPLVHSVAIYKMCQALEINVELVPIEKRHVWIPEQKYVSNTKSGKLNRTKMIPIVRSYMIYKICVSLGLESDFDPLMEPTFFVRKQQNKHKSQEFVPLVKSISVFKICQGLGIKATLASPQEI
ncbi:hypothetical protein TNIN_345741 [Trichonephila inaurata madagascariensis]|uniref:Uncharacterized protein n=1 Tax=Trichonephila inaurata madagascariensis TaxID=2747483 RepID=A0A8X7CRU2_9ARAC|nr:hypothetical protein TNIN_345741 [Trichonephila inaurata madagascariensis]